MIAYPVAFENTSLDFSAIPNGWTRSFVKYLGRYINGYAFKPSDWSEKGKPILRIQNLSDPDADFNRFEGELSDYYLVQTGDILISWSASLSVFQWKGEDAWLNQHVFKVDVDESLVRRDYFVWLAEWFIGELQHRAHGSTMQHLTRDAFGSFPVLLPPLDTQKSLADYLNEKTAVIDQLITAKERLLTLLDEKRRALIAKAVTQGIDRTAKLRKSEIPWLEAIPAHWKVEGGRYLFHQTSLPVRETDEIVTCFRDGQVTLRSNRRTTGFTNAILELGYQGIRAGQLVIQSMDAFAGAIGVSDSDGKCTPEYIVCNPAKPEVFNPYYGLLLREMALQGFIQASCPAVRERAPRIRYSNLKEMYFPLPPIAEQKKIVDYIKSKVDKIDKLAEIAVDTIALLQERRTALIAAAVSGQHPVADQS